MVRISSDTELYCVIGDPVAHSLSPFIMNRALNEHSCEGVYVAFQVTRERVDEAVQGLHGLGVVGANVRLRTLL